MPILSDDILLVRSQVMADVPEGGGAMTGTAIVDGQSNNVFPDISSDDRASGRYTLRKAFGVARSLDSDTLLGASLVVLKPPMDPNVIVTCFETAGWADERTHAIAALEAYLVKGPRMTCRVMDTHYAGGKLLALYNIAPATSFPNPGDAVVVYNPSGVEQYVRVIGTSLSTVAVSLATGMASVNICYCDLKKALKFDVLGAGISVAPPSSATAATVFTTTPSDGVLIHGVKPLALAADVGDRTVYVPNIFEQMVPTTTDPQAITDVYPLASRTTLSRTAIATLTLPAHTASLSPGSVLYLPTAVEPGTLTLALGATAFTSTASGDLKQGETVVGTVDARNKTVTMLGTAPAYGSGSLTISYKPATVTGATAHSLGKVITLANQLTTHVFAMAPPPAPGTLIVSYMAQGRWYDLEDDGTGKLSGASTAYGSGTLNFTTGSLALTLGALPDVGSVILLMWGDVTSARAASARPSRAWCKLPIPNQPLEGSITVSWTTTAGGVQSASISSTGVVTGPAQADEVERLSDGSYLLPFSPDVLPSGNITVNYTAQPEVSAFTNNGGGSYTLTGAPIAPGSLRFNMIASAGSEARVYPCYSRGTVIYTGSTVVGAINNTTGAVTLNGASSVDVVEYTSHRSYGSWSG